MRRAGSRVEPEGDRASVDDAELMRRLAASDLSAMGTLYDRHHEPVRRFLSRATGATGDADDLAQEVFLTAARAAGHYAGGGSARPFLLGIAAQLVRRKRRTLRRWFEALGGLALVRSVVAPRTPEDAAAHAEDIEVFDAALARLPESKRVVYLSIEREGLSGEDVANALKIPVGTVWTRLHHARSALREALVKGRLS